MSPGFTTKPSISSRHRLEFLGRQKHIIGTKDILAHIKSGWVFQSGLLIVHLMLAVLQNRLQDKNLQYKSYHDYQEIPHPM